MGSDVVARAGGNVRTFREKRGWSLKQLARAAGVDAGTVRNAEFGRNVTLATLISVADALEVPLRTLLFSVPDGQPVSVDVLRGHGDESFATGTELVRHLTTISGALRVELQHVRLTPGQEWASPEGSGAHVERFYVLSGAVDVGPEPHTVAARNGDLVTYRGPEPCRMQAGDEPVDVLWIGSTHQE